MTDDPAREAGAGAALLALQAEDVLLDQLEYRKVHLPERAEIVDLVLRRSQLELDRDGVNAQREVLQSRQDAIEADVAEADERLRGLDARASSGEVASFRDQEAVANEMGSVSRRKRELEDEELAIMEELEPHDSALASIVAEQDVVETTRQTLQRQIALSEAEIDAEASVVTDRRTATAALVPPPLLAEYERLRQHLGGVGVARVVHGSCSGCNLHLSAVELDQLHHGDPGVLAHCEQCGRLLVP